MMKLFPKIGIPALAMAFAALTATAGTIVQVATSAEYSGSFGVPPSSSTSCSQSGSAASCSFSVNDPSALYHVQSPAGPPVSAYADASGWANDSNLTMNLYTDADAVWGGNPPGGDGSGASAGASASATTGGSYEVVGGTGSAYLAVDFTGFYVRNIYGGVSWWLDIDGTNYASFASPLNFGCGDPNCYTTRYTNTIYIPVVFGQDYTIELGASVGSGADSPPEAYGIFADDYTTPGFGGGPSASPFSIVDSNGNVIGGLELVPEPCTCLSVAPALAFFLLLRLKRRGAVESGETARRPTSV